MMAMAQAGFVFLSMTKTGSTTIQREFERHAQLVASKPPPMKHMTARFFEASIAPVLTHYGFARESYETVAMVREPVDWAASWWRYRARPGTEGRRTYTGDMGFDEFADRICTGEVYLGSSAKFVSSLEGEVLVDRIYRYEHLDRAAAWMADKLGVKVPELASANVSPERAAAIDPATRAKLEAHYAADLEVYRSAL
ncbi:hypothetical protein FB382_001224 [Nocardioides ginsengisegetis]|uniref:Sulfotransferase family protein n=1 Tax=Nocardioides ginsengisegetis TaxID=661491 RepID=A0A7W3P8X2_9ACTN|nr:hypothetical protein [Nocardioides ginsengisegetis]MBA8802933.1 hypothetical protein [Nocardioides ginsengisegetis]